ncbi:MAG: type II toxin-antitoxin system prevent-host-death family antitoxin [Sulfuritalea sp.]|nr:type II toxin-antitoxin system prevent-host-death family antitoxin [Sulfuritalea sp.]
MQINLLEARTCLSRLVAAAECGEEVILARSGKPVAKIVPYEAPRVKPPGSMRGRIKVLPDRDSPETNADVAELFEASTRLDSSVLQRN